MKKLIALSLTATLLAGCASGPEQGYYKVDPTTGQKTYVPSAKAQNEDTWTTVGVLAVVGAALGGLALGIVNATK